MTPIERAFKPKLEPFPVQVGTVVPTRIDFESFVRPDQATSPAYYDPRHFEASVNVKYSVKSGSGLVSILAEAVFGKDAENVDDKAAPAAPSPPYRLVVAVAAPFVYDPDKVSEAEVIQWCEHGAFFVVSPYLRWLIFSVTAQSGFPHATLPLVLVPILRPKAIDP